MTGRRGFTLVETLVAIAIAAILAAVAAPPILAARERAQAVQALSNLNTIRTALLTYYGENNAWPASGSKGKVPSGLTAYVGSNAFSTTSYSVWYYRYPSWGGHSISYQPLLIVYPTDAGVCSSLYAMLPNHGTSAFAYCSGSSSVVYLFPTT